MDDDNEYKIHLSQMAFVTGTIADKKFLYVGNGIRNLVRSVVFFLIFTANIMKKYFLRLFNVLLGQKFRKKVRK